MFQMLRKRWAIESKCWYYCLFIARRICHRSGRGQQEAVGLRSLPLSRLSMSSAVKLMNLARDVICREPNGITLFRFSHLLLHIHNSGRYECTHDAFPMNDEDHRIKRVGMAISHHRLSERLSLQSLLHVPSGWMNETKALFRPGDSQVAENHHPRIAKAGGPLHPNSKQHTDHLHGLSTLWAPTTDMTNWTWETELR